MWYYTSNGQQYGPVDDHQLDTMISVGTITADTYVWKEGQADWLPLGQVRAIAGSGPGAGAACSICHQAVGTDNLIQLAGVSVCAVCKPKALQSMMEGAPLGSDSAWREGTRIVTSDNALLPKRCVKCNMATDAPPLKRKLNWHHPLYFLLIIPSRILYVIVAIIVRKKGTLHVYLCPEHLQRRKYFMIGGWVGSLLGVIILFTGIFMQAVWMIISGGVILLAAMITGVAGASTVRASRIKGKRMWLKGAGKDFLASLEPYDGS